MNRADHSLPGMRRSKVWGIAACIGVLSFFVSLAILWERQPRTNPEPRPALSVRDTGPSQETMSAPAVARRDEGLHPVTAALIAPLPEAQAPLEPMPVNLQVIHNRRMKRVEGFVGNLSPTSLSVEVDIVNSSTGNSSTLVLDLVPQAMRTFGTDEGMTLTEGDQVTLRSAEYQPISQQVP